METIRFLPQEIKLDEYSVKAILENDTSARIAEEVQLLRTGNFHHPILGELKVTRSMIEQMIRNFNNKVRGVDIAIDYKHDSDDVAAGWIKSLELHENKEDPNYAELWAIVDWTPKGLKKLAEKEFRYLSADFSLNYKDNETLQEFGPTLFGAGLTNRPVVKRMAPAVELTESKGGKMTFEELKKQYDALEQEKVTLSERLKKQEGQIVKLEEDRKFLQELEMTPEQMVAKIKELEAELAKLRGEKEEMLKEAKLSEKERKFDVLLSEGKVVEAQRDSYLKDNLLEFAELAGEINTENKGKQGGKESVTAKGDVQDKVIALAEQRAKERNISVGDAISVVLDENKDLRKKYEEEQAKQA